MVRELRQTLLWLGVLPAVAVALELTSAGVLDVLSQYFEKVKGFTLAAHSWGLVSLVLYVHLCVLLTYAILASIGAAIYITLGYVKARRKLPFRMQLCNGQATDSVRTTEQSVRLNKAYLQNVGPPCLIIVIAGLFLSVLIPLPL